MYAVLLRNGPCGLSILMASAVCWHESVTIAILHIQSEESVAEMNKNI